MNALRRYWFVGSALGSLILAVAWHSQSTTKPIASSLAKAPGTTSETGSQPSVRVADEPAGSVPEPSPEPVKTPVETEVVSVVELHKEADRKNMRLLHKGIFEYKKVHGHFPEYLSQLVPDFVEDAALHSPRSGENGMNGQLAVHTDPGNAKPSYGFEFSNLVFRDGRTFWEIKEVQRAEWGDAVPILRSFGYDKVINMSYGGDLYETELNWEWDPATLDVVVAKGWGPGLDDGQFTKVQVLGASGQPVPNARVWADGRNYSFDLPNRPFLTDANGFARVPLGSDLDRTELVLRFEGYGQASPVVEFPRGKPPENYVLKAALARNVGGTAVDGSGQPLADIWIYLQRSAIGPDGKPATAPGPSLGAVKTDTQGRWSASLHPSDAASFGIAVGSGAMPARFTEGQPVDAYAAAAGNAVTKIEGPAAPVKIGKLPKK